MEKLSKKEKIWVVISVVWFLFFLAMGVMGGQTRDGNIVFMFGVIYNSPLIIGWGLWWLNSIGKFSKKVKIWAVISVVWFLNILMYAARTSSYSPDFNVIQFTVFIIILNLPLIIGWGIWWAKRD